MYSSSPNTSAELARSGQSGLYSQLMFMCWSGEGAALAGTPLPEATGIKPAAPIIRTAINELVLPLIVADLLGGLRSRPSLLAHRPRRFERTPSDKHPITLGSA